MKRIVVIGGKGRIGSYLTPMLSAEGHEVVVITRGRQTPPRSQPVWQVVEQVVLDRKQEDFAQQVVALAPDVVFDLVCYSEKDMLNLTSALTDRIDHYIAVGSIWMHGPSSVVPCPEHLNRESEDTYGQEKRKMDDALQRLFARSGFPGTIVHPGHIVSEGFKPINPQGNINLDVFTRLFQGKTLTLPNMGLETLHHVHAADVAGVMIAAMNRGSISFGQGFHAASPAAITLAGFAQAVAAWVGQEAKLAFQPYEQWAKTVSAEDAAITLEHISRSPNASMEKARQMLDFTPRFSSLQAVRSAVDWLIANGDLSF